MSIKFITILFACFLCRIAVANDPFEDFIDEPDFSVRTIQDANLNRYFSGDYRVIRKTTKLLLKQCPPQDCVLVGVGRSPTPLIAFAKALNGDDSALSLPLSYMGPLFDVPILEARSGVKRKFNLSNFDQHMREFLPSDVLLGGRKIVLVDFAQSGKSLIRTNSLLRDYLGRERPLVEMSVLGLSYYGDILKRLKEAGIGGIKVSFQAQEMFHGRYYRKLAEYDTSFRYNAFLDVPYAKPNRMVRSQLESKIRQAARKLAQKHGTPDYYEREAEEEIKNIETFDDLVAEFRKTIASDPKIPKMFNRKSCAALLAFARK